MASYKPPRQAPDPESRHDADKSADKPTMPRRPAPEPAPKPIFTDWAMI